MIVANKGKKEEERKYFFLLVHVWKTVVERERERERIGKKRKYFSLLFFITRVGDQCW